MNAAVEKLIEETLLPKLIDEFVDIRLSSVPENIDVSEIEKKMKETLGGDKNFLKGLKNLGSKISLLIDSTIDFGTMLASIPMAIIGMGTTGPTISVNLILPLLKQLQGQAKNMSSIYDEVESSLEGFQIPELAEKNETIRYGYETIQGFMDVVSTACALVGVSCGDKEAEDV